MKLGNVENHILHQIILETIANAAEEVEQEHSPDQWASFVQRLRERAYVPTGDDNGTS